jgi:hypothetical protein
MNEQFTFASDPGHGWLLVTENQLIKAGLTPGHFTPYSFKHVWDDVQVYALEEDVDAGVFINHGNPSMASWSRGENGIRRRP